MYGYVGGRAINSYDPLGDIAIAIPLGGGLGGLALLGLAGLTAYILSYLIDGVIDNLNDGSDPCKKYGTHVGPPEKLPQYIPPVEPEKICDYLCKPFGNRVNTRTACMIGCIALIRWILSKAGH